MVKGTVRRLFRLPPPPARTPSSWGRGTLFGMTTAPLRTLLNRDDLYSTLRRTAGALLGGSLLLTLTPEPAGADTYRWIGDDGKVHYSDYLPPHDINKAYWVINSQGVVVKKVEPAKTPEQIAEEQRLAQLRAEQQRRAAEQAEYDRILLDTFTSVADLEETRDRRLATLEGLINVAQRKINNLQQQLARQLERAANTERRGEPVPRELADNIKVLRDQITHEEGYIHAQRVQQAALKERFGEDIARYKALRQRR